MTTFASLLLVVALGAEPTKEEAKPVRPPDVELILENRSTYPEADWPYIRYLWFPAKRSQMRMWENAIRFDIPSNSRALILEKQIPQHVPGTSYWRIDTRDLEWDHYDVCQVLQRHPYHDHEKIHDPLIVRGDWLLWELSDTFESQSHYQLVYGSKSIPKTRDEWYKFWKVTVDEQRSDNLLFGMIEGKSGVSVVGVRWLEFHDRPRGYSSSTRDVLKLDLEHDMLEKPDGSFEHDGEEHIVGYPKVSLELGESMATQFYLLANGKGQRVEKAPVDLVEDRMRFKDLAEIRNRGSCIICHPSGMNMPTRNEMRRAIEAGLPLYIQDDKRKREVEKLEVFHFTAIEKEILPLQDKFVAFVRACNGLEPSENADNYKAAIDAYGARLDLHQCSRELRCTPAELRFSVAYANENKLKIPRALADLVQTGEPIPRESWEQLYVATQRLVDDWKATQ